VEKKIFVQQDTKGKNLPRGEVFETRQMKKGDDPGDKQLKKTRKGMGVKLKRAPFATAEKGVGDRTVRTSRREGFK